MTDTPRTDSAATGFARLMVDKDTFTVTEIIPSDFARTLEREVGSLMTALELIAKGTDGHQSFSGTDCAEIARQALERSSSGASS